MGGIFALVAFLGALFTVTAICEGTTRLCRRMKEEASFRKMLKGGGVY